MGLILFLFLVLFFLLIPVWSLFKILKIDKITDILVNIGVTSSLGIVLLTLFALIIRILGFEFNVIWILPFFSLLYIFLKRRKEFNNYKSLKDINRPSLYIIIFILIGVVAQNLVLFRGGMQVAEGRLFPSAHDTMWNIALSNELYHHFPPQHPGVAGEPLKNNHYFYPLFLAAIRSITQLDIFDLYFRFGPILISFLFGLSLYSVSTLFTKNKFFQGVTIFLGYFSGSFAYLTPFFLGPNFDWKGNTFFSDQPFDQIINPYSVLGFTFFLFGLYSLNHVIRNKKYLSVDSLIPALYFGSLFGFKSFGGIVAIGSLVVSSLFSTIFFRNLRILLITIITIIIFVPIFSLITDSRSSSLNWAPGWLLTQLMTDSDKLNLPRFGDIERYYQAINNYAGHFKIKFIELLIYLTGNLGTRLLGLVFITLLFFRNLLNRKKNYQVIIIFIFFAIVISFSIPLLFNLKNSTFNIIQFTPYALVLLALMTGLALEKIYYFFEQKSAKFVGILVILLIIILSIPVNVKNVLSKLENPSDLIPENELEALNYLKQNSKPTDVIFINPLAFNIDPIYISAISERRVYLASPGYSVQTGIDPSTRLKNITNFFQGNLDIDFLKNNNIALVYILKTKYNDTNKKFIFENLISLFENNQVIIIGIK